MLDFFSLWVFGKCHSMYRMWAGIKILNQTRKIIHNTINENIWKPFSVLLSLLLTVDLPYALIT